MTKKIQEHQRNERNQKWYVQMFKETRKQNRQETEIFQKQVEQQMVETRSGQQRFRKEVKCIMIMI